MNRDKRSHLVIDDVSASSVYARRRNYFSIRRRGLGGRCSKPHAGVHFFATVALLIKNRSRGGDGGAVGKIGSPPRCQQPHFQPAPGLSLGSLKEREKRHRALARLRGDRAAANL